MEIMKERREMKRRLLNAPNADIKKKGDVSPRSAPSAVEKRLLRRNRGDWRTREKEIGLDPRRHP